MEISPRKQQLKTKYERLQREYADVVQEYWVKIEAKIYIVE